MMRTRMLVVAVAVVVSVGSVVSAQDQNPQRGRGRGFGGFQMTAAMIVNNEAVQADLKLDDDQKAKLKDLPRVDFRSLGDLSREERAKKMEETNAAAKKVIDETLNDEQKKRVDQILLQSRGASALNTEEVAAKLELTDDQKKQIKEIPEVRFERPADGQRPDIAAMQKAREERDAKIVAVLTDEQKKKYEELKGPAFDVAKLRQFGGRRPGGNTTTNNNNNN